jgi:hypothetical protein
LSRTALLTIGAAALLLCACGTKVVVGQPALQPATPSPVPTTLTALGLAIEASTKTITSEHLQFATTINETTGTGEGNERIADGHASAADLTEKAGSESERLIDDGDVLYVQLPTSLMTTGKPWQVASDDSLDPELQDIYDTFFGVQDLTEPDSAVTYVAAATSTSAGTADEVNGAPATHYVLTVDTTQMAGTVAGDPTDAHLDLWIDRANRPVKTRIVAKTSRATVDSTLTLGNFNAPVTIAPPPADQIAPN